MRKPNIVIIVLDTLREDHAQGLDMLLDYGFVKYQNAIAPATWTLPSHVSMFTGLYPSEHGIPAIKEISVHEKSVIFIAKLAELSRIRMAKLADNNIITKKKDEGYTTYLISANFWITPYTGFAADHNFHINPLANILYTDDLYEIYRKVWNYGGPIKFVLNNFKNPILLHKALKFYITGRVKQIPKYLSERAVMEKGARTVLSLLEALTLQDPYLLFINIMEAHEPYTRLTRRKKFFCYIAEWLATGRLNPEAPKLWRNYPAHAKRATDRAVEIVATLARKTKLDNTLVIITADHGELLGDGGLHHGFSLKDGIIRVPLYVKYPEGWKKKNKKTYISLSDIPKILDPSTDTIGSDLAIAEAFGLYRPDHLFQECGLGNPSANWFYHHKIRILGNEVDILFNKTLEHIEYAKGEQAQDVLRKLLH
jgi:arylsulfatase A-like enzyme